MTEIGDLRNRQTDRETETETETSWRQRERERETRLRMTPPHPLAAASSRFQCLDGSGSVSHLAVRDGRADCYDASDGRI